MRGVTPDGWQEYLDPQFGWRIAVPGDWEPVQDRADRVAFRDPRTGAFTRVDRAEDPLEPLRREPLRAELTYRDLGYRRLKLTPTTYKGQEAVEWEFTYTTDGTQYHAADLHVLVDDVDYVISFQAPEVLWPSARPNLERIRNSFEVS